MRDEQARRVSDHSQPSVVLLQQHEQGQEGVPRVPGQTQEMFKSVRSNHLLEEWMVG